MPSTGGESELVVGGSPWVHSPISAPFSCTSLSQQWFSSRDVPCPWAEQCSLAAKWVARHRDAMLTPSSSGIPVFVSLLARHESCLWRQDAGF